MSDVDACLKRIRREELARVAAYFAPGMRLLEIGGGNGWQASLLAAGSLDLPIVRRLGWRPRLTRRYLAVEGHRALAANAHVLPLPVRSLIDGELAARGDSPAASLRAASRRGSIGDPPESFGAIRARRLLAPNARAGAASRTRAHAPRRQRDPVLVELEEGPDDEVAAPADPFSSPVGGGGAEHVQHQLADRVGGQVAVADQVGEGAVTGHHLVALVGRDQPQQRVGGQPARLDGGRQPDQHRVAGGDAVVHAA